MMNRLFGTLRTGGLAMVLATAAAVASQAQTAAPDVPAGEVTRMEAIEFPVLTSVATDEEVAADLVAQGYQNIVVVRTPDALVVAAERGGVPTEMVFSPVDGTLIMIDGVAPMGAPPAGSAVSD
ncbi:hypothetical protein PANO111632_14935 [Paracoccus nototheniae]|uniref:Uncharacterized protein n=1 Tax=Paracoccus nototheniae TaxID=2489002 RepID=A0ABW4DT05_9RHOB|nr:hypothetical protein [Paracoccus nototheniae]